MSFISREVWTICSDQTNQPVARFSGVNDGNGGKDTDESEAVPPFRLCQARLPEPFWRLKWPDSKEHLAEKGRRKFLPGPAPSRPLN